MHADTYCIERNQWLCRRYPPQLIAVENSDAWSEWPVVSGDEWCGEHKESMDE